MLACRGAPAPEQAKSEVAPRAAKPAAPQVAEAKRDVGSAELEPPALDIEYVATPMNVVDKMLEVATITKDDVVYDLGCGDARLLIGAATKYGARGFGFDLDPERIAEARANVERAGVGHLVTITQQNFFAVDLAPATVVMLYLAPELNVRLVPQLERLAPKSRIVSHDFDIKGYDPDDIWKVVAEHHRPPRKDRNHYVYLWTAPLARGDE